MQRFYKIIVVLPLLLGKRAAAQQKEAIPLASTTNISIIGKQVNSSLKLPRPATTAYLLSHSAEPVFSYRLVAPDFYTRHLAFFCRTELQLEKKLNVPLRFRLGSYEYTNKLEGKK
jgi:hypothetical protein